MPYGAQKSGSSYSGAGQSSVGQPSIYEAGDQRNEPQSVINERERYNEGQRGSHKNLDSKDERSIANKLAAQEKHSGVSSNYQPEAALSKRDPTAPATRHGHEPSKGAKIDKELQEEDDQRLREKGIKK
ncbi:uncharacterized protein ACLA_016090 [Aspergillus clavatus NRRL 1]|uniref:Uncharacterized protein n=1 Tax=Aspergillus clavatus (strain ATCC 1007 / CBS 513.65 / DSM 816 / NCTC 3887 / NRRL 1 / QM 1276 / 107) TaxID=344612 RepID=A1CBP5_ASPCL|nr:uncharacterized protein ACLA_016090 [Aspergillus clavatus NRRL 1]EAW13163.1 conserved hypothetical protein [Aspergillus clavatus NRRL 1]